MVTPEIEYYYLDLDIQQSAYEYNALTSPGIKEAFLSAKGEARERLLELLECTDLLLKIDAERVMKHPKTLSALRWVCLPPLTKDRLSGLSMVPIKRIYALEDGEIPSRPTGRSKLIEAEIPAIIGTVMKHLDHSLAPWVCEGRKPDRHEVERFVDVVSDRAAIMSDISSTPKLALDKKIEGDISTWLYSRGYLFHTVKPGEDVQNLPRGCFSTSPAVFGEKGKRKYGTDFVVAPANGKALVFIDVKVSTNSTHTLRLRKATDVPARQAAEMYDGTYVLVLCGYFDSAYVKYQLSQGKNVVWHHALDALSDLSL